MGSLRLFSNGRPASIGHDGRLRVQRDRVERLRPYVEAIERQADIALVSPLCPACLGSRVDEHEDDFRSPCKTCCGTGVKRQEIA